MSNKQAVVMTILVIAVIELSGYIIYDKVINKPKEQKETEYEETITKKEEKKEEKTKEEDLNTITYTTLNTEGEKSILELNDDGTFSFKVNLCEGIGNIKGNYKEENNTITLTDLTKDFAGSFVGTELRQIVLNRENEIKLVIKNQIGCISENDSLELIK